uniref:Uncharacterized protein n=1 Tax=Anguilla anguilla TaxID=7936 RepID=A0A0E9WTP7_ANGAN
MNGLCVFTLYNMYWYYYANCFSLLMPLKLTGWQFAQMSQNVACQGDFIMSHCLYHMKFLYSCQTIFYHLS